MPGILVVGGGGFIGRHVLRRAIVQGWDATSLGLNPVADRSLNDRHIVADLRDRVALEASLTGQNFDYVVNCGGYVDHRLMQAGGRDALDVHFSGLVNLVECLDRQSLRGFVNLGSSDEYGSAAAPQAESLRESPISPYSLAKVAATHFLQMLHRTEAFPAVTLRLFLTYGPGQDQRRFIPQIVQGCLKGDRFPTSHGEQLRDFCYVDDTVDAIFASLDSEAARGEVINIASGQPVSIRQMIDSIRELISSGTPDYGAVPYRAGENMALYADVRKAQQVLNWTARTNLLTGLKRTIASLREAG